MTGTVNRNTRRLMAGVVAAWLVAATGGLAVLPFGGMVVAFCAAFVAFVVVTLWNVAAPRKGLWRQGPYPTMSAGDVLAVMRRYRLRWLALLTAVVFVMGAFNAFSGAAIVLAVAGERVTAQPVRTEVQPDGYVECTLAHSDGSPIAGTLLIEGSECPRRPEVLVDPLGLLDPVLYEDGLWGITLFAFVLLVAALALTVPTARPRSAGELPSDDEL